MQTATQGDRERARHGRTRQRKYQIRHKDAGLCQRCTRPMWKGSHCFRCHLRMALSKARLLGEATKVKKSWELFVICMMARHERILHDEGFAVDIIAPSVLIDTVGWHDWCKGRAKKKVMRIINAFDDFAIRKRFSGEEEEIES